MNESDLSKETILEHAPRYDSLADVRPPSNEKIFFVNLGHTEDLQRIPNLISIDDFVVTERTYLGNTNKTPFLVLRESISAQAAETSIDNLGHILYTLVSQLKSIQLRRFEQLFTPKMEMIDSLDHAALIKLTHELAEYSDKLGVAGQQLDFAIQILNRPQIKQRLQDPKVLAHQVKLSDIGNVKNIRNIGDLKEELHMYMVTVKKEIPEFSNLLLHWQQQIIDHLS